VWWLRRARFPLFDLGVFSARTFRATATGGFVYRLTISAVPFLLPLMFQNGFGWDPLRAGAFVAAVFVGNIGIKPATTPLIRRFGFKSVLVFSSLASAATFALCALLDSGTPDPLIIALLVASGAFRSIGFSAYASVQYADVAPDRLPTANAVSATLVQLAAAAGIATAALLVRISEAGGLLGGTLAAGGAQVAPYRTAFLAIAALMLLSTLDSLTLPRQAGSEVSRPGPTPAAARRRRLRA